MKATRHKTMPKQTKMCGFISLKFLNFRSRKMPHKPLNLKGFTIVETMMFLTVSAAIFVIMVGFINGQNRRTEFTQSVQTMENNLRDVLNDTETGFYPTNDMVRCESGPSVSSDNREQGSNESCIFLGKAIQFAPRNEPKTINVFTVVGNSHNDGSVTTSLSEANPVALSENQAIVDSFTARASTIISDVIVNSGSSGGFAVLSGFGALDNSAIVSGNVRASLWSINDSDTNISPFRFANLVTVGNLNQTSEPIKICLEDGSGGRRAEINIGVDNSKHFSVTSEIDSDSSECEP